MVKKKGDVTIKAGGEESPPFKVATGSNGGAVLQIRPTRAERVRMALASAKTAERRQLLEDWLKVLEGER